MIKPMLAQVYDSNKFTISLVSNAASTETGGGFFAFAGPVNQRS